MVPSAGHIIYCNMLILFKDLIHNSTGFSVAETLGCRPFLAEYFVVCLFIKHEVWSAKHTTHTRKHFLSKWNLSNAFHPTTIMIIISLWFCLTGEIMDGMWKVIWSSVTSLLFNSCENNYFGYLFGCFHIYERHLQRHYFTGTPGCYL